jgi:dipeptidyl aminopeptidase/acylaminoacyl peptidase
VSERDPLELLAQVGRAVQPRSAFAESLLAECLEELQAPSRPTLRLRLPRNRALRLLVAVGAALVLAAAATATYLAARKTASAVVPRAAQLTVIQAHDERIRGVRGSLAAIAVLDSGRLRTVWRCPKHIWCGDLTSMAWSPNGRRLAMTLGEIGGRSGYVGLHVIDLASGTDTHLGSLPIPNIEREQPTSVLQRLVAESVKKLGCPLPHQVAWAPDSTRLAYVCGDDLLHGGERTTIYLINANGTGKRRLPTHTTSAYWPSWSPDGTRIAFATAPFPHLTVQRDTKFAPRRIRSDVYATRTDGTERTLLARAGSAPSWSPDGKLIAYEATCGIRLVTSNGIDETPGRSAGSCPHIGITGEPLWSPDGTQLAIGTSAGTWLMQPDGTALHRATRASGTGPLSAGRPAWAPATALERLLQRQPQTAL